MRLRKLEIRAGQAARGKNLTLRGTIRDQGATETVRNGKHAKRTISVGPRAYFFFFVDNDRFIDADVRLLVA